MQNINYGNLIYNKIRCWLFIHIFIEMYFCSVGMFCNINCYFYAFFGFGVIFFIYEYVLKICL